MKKIFHVLTVICMCSFSYLSAAKPENDNKAEERIKRFTEVINSGSRDTLRNYLNDNSDPDFIKRLPLEISISFNMAFYYGSAGEGYKYSKILSTKKNRIQALLINRFTDAEIEINFPIDGTTGKINNIIEMRLASQPEIERVKFNDAEIIHRVEKCIDMLVKNDEFSGSVLLAKGGVPIFEKAYGHSNKSDEILNNIETKFNIASLGKMFTGIAVAQLVEKGKLSFDDTVSKYISADWLNPEISKKNSNKALTDTYFRSRRLFRKAIHTM